MGSHKCFECGKTFAAKFYLSKHILTHSGNDDGRTFGCHLCQKRFIISSHLQEHLRSHSARCDHLCEICGRRFRHSKQLRIHKARHDGVKAFSCDGCDYRTAALSCLLRHRRRHTGEAPYPCVTCGRQFLTRQNLAEHRRRRHGDEPQPDPAGSSATDTSVPISSRVKIGPGRSGSSDTDDPPPAEDAFGLSLRPAVFLEDDDGSGLLERVTLTSAAAALDPLADPLFAEEPASAVFHTPDTDSMVLDERVPMVGVELELNDQ